MSNSAAAGQLSTKMGRGSWLLVLLLMATCFMAHFNRVSIAVAYNMRLEEDYGISKVQMGWVYAAFLWAYTLFMLPGGWLIDRKGPLFSLLVVGIGSALFALLTGAVGLTVATAAVAFPALLVIRSLMGVLSAPLHPAAARAVSFGIPSLRRTVANGLITAAAVAGIAATYLLFPLLLEAMDWPAVFAVSAIVTIVVALLWAKYGGKEMQQTSGGNSAAYPPASRSEAIAERPPGMISSIRRNKNLLLLAFSYGAVGYFQYLFFYWIGNYFKDDLELGLMASQYYTCIPIVAMAVGMFIGGWVGDALQARFGWRVARAHFAVVVMTASAALLYVGVRCQSTVWIIALLSMSLGILGLLEGSFWTTAVDVGGKRGGLAAAVMNTSGNLFGALQNIVTPWIKDDLGYEWHVGITVGSVVCLIGGLLWIWIDEPSQELKTLAHTQDVSHPVNLSLTSATNTIL